MTSIGIVDRAEIKAAEALVQSSQFESLQRPTRGEDDRTGADLLVSEEDPEAAVVGGSSRETLVEAISDLSERERTVLLSRYVGNLTQREVRDRLGLSNSRVARIERIALQRLRQQLADEMAA